MFLARTDFQLRNSQNLNVRYSHQGNDVTEQLIVDPNVGYGGPPAENANQHASNRPKLSVIHPFLQLFLGTDILIEFQKDFRKNKCL